MPQGPLRSLVVPVWGPCCWRTGLSLVMALFVPGRVARVPPHQRLPLRTEVRTSVGASGCRM
eukprot:10407116-Prorocentrum_lima.AAC.1